jgi:alkylhydroperoxidase family enzyme
MTTDNAEPRIDYRKVAPQAIQALWAVERYARECKIEAQLLELVKLRASMINGCAIIAINAWTRQAIAFRAVASTYEPAKRHSAE